MRQGALKKNVTNNKFGPIVKHRYMEMFLKMGQSRPLFVYFRYFLDAISIIQIEKSIDDVLGIRIRGRRMVGKEETTDDFLLS